MTDPLMSERLPDGLMLGFSPTRAAPEYRENQREGRCHL
jgi:hypothetical protein